APATKRVSRRRSNANSLRPLLARRARRRIRADDCALRGPAAADARATSLEDSDAVGRPVGGEGSADDPSCGDGAPEPAVVGFATVVAHHEPVPGRNLDRCREVALLAAPAGADVGVLLTY